MCNPDLSVEQGQLAKKSHRSGDSVTNLVSKSTFSGGQNHEGKRGVGGLGLSRTRGGGVGDSGLKIHRRAKELGGRLVDEDPRGDQTKKGDFSPGLKGGGGRGGIVKKGKN